MKPTWNRQVNNVFTHFLVQMRLKVTWKYILKRNYEAVLCALSFGNLSNLRSNLHWRQIIWLLPVYKVVHQESLIAESFKSSHRKKNILLPLVHRDICSKNSWQKYFRTRTGEKPYSSSKCCKSFPSYVRWSGIWEFISVQIQQRLALLKVFCSFKLLAETFNMSIWGKNLPLLSVSNVVS
jgi:hypothetical protein